MWYIERSSPSHLSNESEMNTNKIYAKHPMVIIIKEYNKAGRKYSKLPEIGHA